MNFEQKVKKTLQRAGVLSRITVVAATFALAAWFALPEIVSGTGTAYAQNTNATIRGSVIDPSGALIPNAKVVIVNKNSGVTVFNGKSDSAGSFVAPQVIPGMYKITVTADGLKESVIDNLIASVAQVASVNVTMEVGATTEVVTVMSKGEELDRSTSDISTLISPEDVQNLPIANRSTENLLAFIPGVAHGGAGDTPSTSQLSINGSRTLNTEVLLNGVSTIVASTGTPATLPSPDGVDSFRAITTNAPAEYGRTSGAVISVNTVSGTNTYHGSLYYLMKNEDFDANTYFNKITFVNGVQVPRKKDRFFQMGGSIGGAVRIPHIYNGHDKTFFFFNYDRTLTPASSLLTFTVPTAAQRTGDLSNGLGAKNAAGNAAPQIVYQPSPRGQVPANLTTPAYVNNQVTGLDPAAAKILALLPLPNSPGTFDPINNRYTGNWTSQQNLTGHYQRIVGRVDEVITPKDRLSINIYRFTTATPNAISWENQLLNTTWDCTCNNAWLPSIDYTRTWNPTLVTDLNMGFFRNVVLRNPPGSGLGAGTKFGIASLPLDQTPEITDPGFSNIGADTNTNQVNITNTYTPFGTVTKTFGKHTFKVGASLRKNEFNSYNPAASPEGAIGFAGNLTNHGSTGTPTTGIADFLLGEINSYSYEQPMPETGRRNFNLGVFFQDDYRVTPKLTLNLGIRYEYESPLIIATDVYSRFDPNTGLFLQAGVNATRSLNVSAPTKDVSPRVGLAYSINNKTVIRAAGGTFYGTIFQNLGGQLAYPGYDNTFSSTNLGTGVPQVNSLSQGFTLQPAPNLKNPAASTMGFTAASPYNVSGVSFNQLNPMALVQQWNLGIQRQLPLAITLEVNYVGNHALHLAYVIPANIVPLASVDAVTLANTTTTTQNAKPFPTLGSFSVVNGVGHSNYNALQVSVRRQFNRSLAVLSNYTYGKSEDDGSTIYNFSAPNGTANAQYTADGAHRAMDFAVSNIDVTHTLNIAVVYTTPGPWYLRDWHISPVFVGHTGLPINITQTNEISNVSQQRPNGNPQLVRLAHPFIVPGGNQLQYYDSPATDPNFPLTPTGPVYVTVNGVRTRIVSTGFGNVGRDSNRAPGEVDFDASVSKDFPIYERLKFQLRFDAFNVINHTNFSAPSGALSISEQSTAPTVATFAGSTGFGRISGTTPARTMQASARFVF